jgi:hypothetical protein
MWRQRWQEDLLAEKTILLKDLKATLRSPWRRNSLRTEPSALAQVSSLLDFPLPYGFVSYHLHYPISLHPAPPTYVLWF